MKSSLLLFPNRYLAVAACCLLLLFLLASYLIWPSLKTALQDLSTLQLGILASLVAGLFTSVGALPIFFIRSLNKTLEDTLMGFGAGIMLAATAFELVLPAMNQAEQLYKHPGITLLMLSSGIALGGGLLYLLHDRVPHEHFIGGRDNPVSPHKIKRVWLFIFAIALHNLPEGLAVGAGFGGSDLASGVALAIGIGLQNMPEGLVVAIALLSLGHSRLLASGVTLLTGLVQPLGGLLGAFLVSLVSSLMPLVLAFAAGAMLFVISHEIIPESHRLDNKSKATFGVLVGFIVMLAIDILLD